ncbi:hypothetical protein MTO96_029887 [Rhipicephalus appendiculatus]
MSTAIEKPQGMVELRVIKAAEPTQLSGMVMVQKPDEDVRTCVDLTKLNKFLERQVYSLPVSEHDREQLAGAQYFSQADANSEFRQFEWALESRNITTITTPLGQRRFKRLLFGISSALVFFQRKMSQFLE